MFFFGCFACLLLLATFVFVAVFFFFFFFKQAIFSSGLSPLVAVGVHQNLDRACQNHVVAAEFIIFLFFVVASLLLFFLFGKQATFFSGLSPVAAVDVHRSLDKACQNLVVATELHALYLLTPLAGLEPDWARFREEYTAWREDDPARVVGKAVRL